MRVDALAVRLRPRAPLEAADLGARLCRSASKDVYRCYVAVAVPVMALLLATYEIADWLPAVALWWIKPWLDRTILFVLARAAFGQSTSLGDLWRAQGQVWWRQLFLTLTWRRLSPWRSFTQPVYQLEGHSFFKLRRRVLQIRGKRTGPALLMTSAFSLAETALTVAVSSLLIWFAPENSLPDFTQLFEDGQLVSILWSIAYALVVLFLETFYVASGFAMYLNRRADLEAWDIEQEFRRAFPQ